MSNQERVPYFPTSLVIFNDLSRLEVSVSAWVVLDYLIRHTKGWKNSRWVTLRIQDFIQGRPTPSGNRYDHGIPIKHPATVQAALEELGVKGFILELDEGRNDGRCTYGLQAKYFTDDPEQAAKLTTTAQYRFLRREEDGKYWPKPDAEQQPHYYRVTFKPLQKLKSEPKRGEKSSIIEEDTSTIEGPTQLLKSRVSIIEEQEGYEDSVGAGPGAGDIQSTAHKMIDNKTNAKVAPSARTPVSLPLVDEEKEDQETASMQKLLLAERAKWEAVTMRDSTWGEAQRELRRINRALKRLEG